MLVILIKIIVAFILILRGGKPDDKVFQAIADKFGVSFYTQHNNEDGGWEERDYHYSPHQPMYSETCQWQIDENTDCCEEE